jgi:hypothetical protein
MPVSPSTYTQITAKSTQRTLAMYASLAQIFRHRAFVDDAWNSGLADLAFASLTPPEVHPAFGMVMITWRSIRAIRP